MDRVVLSSDEHSSYAFYAPLTCAVWRRTGYLPTLLLVGEESVWRGRADLRLALEASLAAGAEVHFVDSHPGYRTATVAQVSRLFASALPTVEPGDYLLTSDIDMWPVGPWVGGGRDPLKDFQIYYANAYPDIEHVQYPICYLGAKARTWRKVVFASSENLLAVVAPAFFLPGRDTLRDGVIAALRELDRVLRSTPSENVALRTWDFDERHFGGCLSAWRGYQHNWSKTLGYDNRCQLIDRDTLRDGERRLDRPSWPIVAGQVVHPDALRPYADAHLPRPGFSDANWPRVRPLLKALLAEEEFELAEDYRAAWVAAQETSAS